MQLNLNRFSKNFEGKNYDFDWQFYLIRAASFSLSTAVTLAFKSYKSVVFRGGEHEIKRVREKNCSWSQN